MKKSLGFSLLTIIVVLFLSQIVFSQTSTNAPSMSNPQEMLNKWDAMKLRNEIAEANKQVELNGIHTEDTTSVTITEVLDTNSILVFRSGLLQSKSSLVFSHVGLTTKIVFPTVVATTEEIIVVK